MFRSALKSLFQARDMTCRALAQVADFTWNIPFHSAIFEAQLDYRTTVFALHIPTGRTLLERIPFICKDRSTLRQLGL